MSTPYRQQIMRHSLAPHHKGALSRPTRLLHGANPTCGDELAIGVKLDSRGRITRVGWEGSGCTISQAATSILSDVVVGKKLSVAQKMESTEFLRLLGIELSPTRRKCALLALYTLKQEDVDDIVYA